MINLNESIGGFLRSEIPKPVNMIIMVIHNIFRVLKGHYLHTSYDYFNDFCLHDNDIALSF